MATGQDSIARLETLVKDVWQNPLVGFDARFADLHGALEEVLDRFRALSHERTEEPVFRAMLEDMHQALKEALDLFDEMYSEEGNVPDDMFESEKYVLFITLLSAAYGFSELLMTQAQAQPGFIGPMPKPGRLHLARSPVTTVETTAAEVFAENLKQMLREEGVTLYEFTSSGPFPTSKAARELLMGKVLPSLPTIKLIAKTYRVDPDRLLKNINPELLC